MSQRRLLIEQQARIRGTADGTPLVQGKALYPVDLYDCPGTTFYGGREQDRQIFTVPKGMDIDGVREGDFRQDLPNTSGPVSLNTLGIRLTKHDTKFPYRVNFDLTKAVNEAGDGKEIKHTPAYPEFTNPGIFPPDLALTSGGGTTTTTVSTRVGVPGRRTTRIWRTFYTTWTKQNETTGENDDAVEITNTPFHTLGTDISDQVSGEITEPNIIQSISPAYDETHSPYIARDVLGPQANAIPVFFRSSTDAGALPTIRVYWSFGALSNSNEFLKRNPGTRDLSLQIICRFEIRNETEVYATRTFIYNRRRLNNVPRGGNEGADSRTNQFGSYQVSQVYEVKTTDTTVFVPGTEERTTRLNLILKQYAGNTATATKTLQLPSSADPTTHDFTVPKKADSIGITFPGFGSLLRDYSTGLPRTFTNRAETAYVTERAQRIDKLTLESRGPAVLVPSNAFLINDDYLQYQGSWNRRFKRLRTRCPAWILYWVMTEPLFGLENKQSDFDLDSFYNTSVYNQELVNGKPRFCFDGLLSGSIREMIRALLSTMRGSLHNNNRNQWVLANERPTTSRWLISNDNAVNGQITYRLSTEKPGVQASFLNRKSGDDDLTSRTTLTDVAEAYPGQDPDCALLWAKWRTWEQQQLLDTVEMRLPFATTNNQGAATNYHKIGVYDIIELYDAAEMGIRLAGRVADSGPNWVQLDEPPMELFPGGTLDEGGWMRLSRDPSNMQLIFQQRDGGLVRRRVRRIGYEAGEPRNNRFDLSSSYQAIVGSTWGIYLPNLQPKHFRVLSVKESDGGLSTTLICRPYITGMHGHVELDRPLSIENHIFKPTCGPNVYQFNGLAQDVHLHYQKNRPPRGNNRAEWDRYIQSLEGSNADLNTSC